MVDSSCFSSFSSSSNFIRIIKKISGAIEDEPSQRNILDSWKSSIKGISEKLKDVKILHAIIHNFYITNYRDFMFVKNDH